MPSRTLNLKTEQLKQIEDRAKALKLTVSEYVRERCQILEKPLEPKIINDSEVLHI